jgi:class 3 adenylate cyclase
MGITVSDSPSETEMILTNENNGSDFTAVDEETVSFNESSLRCCVGIIDIVGSTKMTAGLPHSKIGKYYHTFFSTMVPIVKKYGGIVVKNGGDSLLYYFQETPSDDKSMFLRCLECGLAMLEARCILNTKLSEEKIPSLSFRISVDYGKVTLANSSNLSYHDIFGTPVNICSKINGKAQPNTIVIGGDLYQEVKSLSGYSFSEVSGYSVGFKFQYSVYGVARDQRKCRALVETAIERTLVDMSTNTLDTISGQLFKKHNCLLSTCYKKPEYLRDVLIDMFGNAYAGIVQEIRNKLGSHTQQKPIMTFLEKLSG